MALLPLCSAVSQRFQQEPFLLPALFRLVAAAQRRTAGESQSQASEQSGASQNSGNSGNSGNEGWVEQVGAMAGCPILLSNAESLDGLDRKNRETVLLSRVAASLWLRAVVEVFADCPQSVVRFKVGVLAGNERRFRSVWRHCATWREISRRFWRSTDSPSSPREWRAPETAGNRATQNRGKKRARRALRRSRRRCAFC